MLIIILVWIVQFLVFVSAGLIAKKILEWTFKEELSLSLIQEIVLGLCFISLLLSFLSLGEKISLLVFRSILLVSIIIFIINYKRFIFKLNYILSYFKKQNAFSLSLFVIFFVFCLLYSAGEARIFDTGLYHAQSIRWINEYGVVPGLGNLHSRFAFNSHFFLIQALFDFSFFTTNDFVVYGVNSFFYLLIMFRVLKKLLESGISKDLVFYFLVILVSTVVILPRIQSPSPDIISFLLIVHILLVFYEMKFRYSTKNTASYIYIFVVICYLLTVKLSNVPLLLFALAFYRMLSLKNIFKPGIIGSLFLIPFFIRNYFLSGYLIYPFPSIDVFHPDWKIPISQCFAEINSIKAWAVAPGADPSEVLALPYLQKIKLWLSNLDPFSKIIVMSNVFILFVILKKLRDKAYEQSVFWGIILVNILYWFLNAPDPRFCFGILTFSFAYIVSRITAIKALELKPAFIKPFAAIILFAVLFAYASFKFSYVQNAFNNNLLIPEPLKTVEYTEEQGIRVTKDPEGKCFNTKLPCACEKIDGITFRTNNIKDGFKIIK